MDDLRQPVAPVVKEFMIKKTKRNSYKLVLLALASVALLAPVGQAATVTANLGDLVVGFQVQNTGSAPGFSSDLEVDLGPVSQFYGGTNVTLTALAVQDLINTYGSAWATRSDLLWGAVATAGRDFTGALGFPSATLWATAPAGIAWVPSNYSAQSIGSAAMETMFSGASAGRLNGKTATTNSAHAAVVNNGLTGSWTVQDLLTDGVSSFGFFNPTVDSVANPGSGSVAMDLYEVEPDTAGQVLGRLILTQQGLRFQAPGGSSAPVIGVSGNLAFGNVTTGRTATAALTIANTGNTNLTVSTINYPSGFSGVFSGTIAAGGATNVTVSFAPMVVGSYGGTVTVNSDATSGTSTISASGTGTVAAVVTAAITVQGNPGNGGAVTGSGTYPVGTNVPITATANSNWTFTGWSDGSTQSPHTITVPATNFTYTATFVQQTATIGVVASPSGSGSVHGAGTYPVGTNIQITATANLHWRFTGWNDGNTNATRSIAVTGGGATYTANFAAVVSVAPPVIVTPPVITNGELVVGSQFVVVAGDTNVFTVGATDTMDNTLLRYQWNFGDGVTSDWSDSALATHSYPTNSCGHYNASVIVSNTQFAIRSNLTVNVACQLTITKMQLGVNFGKSGSDSIGLTAKLSLPEFTTVAQLNGITVVADVGDAQFTFPLSNKGRGVNANGSCSLAYTKPTKTKAGYWTLTVTLSKGNWRSSWANYGLDNATHKSPGVAVTLPVTVLIGIDAVAVEPQLHYSATLNKTGTAK